MLCLDLISTRFPFPIVTVVAYFREEALVSSKVSLLMQRIKRVSRLQQSYAPRSFQSAGLFPASGDLQASQIDTLVLQYICLPLDMSHQILETMYLGPTLESSESISKDI